MTREEDKELLSNLIFANKKFAENLEELRKLDGIATRAKALNELDTQAIAQKLQDMSLTHVSKLIVTKLNEQFESQKTELLKSSAVAEQAAIDLSKKAENLRVVADGFQNLDNMSDSLSEVSKDIKNWRIKNMYAAIGLSLFFGLVGGTIVSNIGSLFRTEIVENTQILEPFGKIAAIQNAKDPNMFYFAFDTKKIKPEVESFEQNGVRYILFEVKR